MAWLFGLFGSSNGKPQFLFKCAQSHPQIRYSALAFAMRKDWHSGHIYEYC